MSARGNRLHATADAQIAELLDLIAALDEETSRRPCQGRDKLGDGTLAASASHTADNYGRIAGFVAISRGADGADHGPGHGPGPAAGGHENPYTADNTDLAAVARQLSGTREAIGHIAELTDRELDAIPAQGSFRFCDGRRTREQVLASLLKHQAHQLDALRSAVGS